MWLIGNALLRFRQICPSENTRPLMYFRPALTSALALQSADCSVQGFIECRPVWAVRMIVPTLLTYPDGSCDAPFAISLTECKLAPRIK